MKGINEYHRELAFPDIARNEHREYVGGLWEEIGTLQMEFLRNSGLQPHHKLLDVGCGCLRGGIHFVRFLQPGNYHGLDINSSLIEAARVELGKAGLTEKRPTLLVDDAFMFSRFKTTFDVMISVSLFTHLPGTIIVECLQRARESLSWGGRYYATFFMVPDHMKDRPFTQHPGGFQTWPDRDLFHYAFSDIKRMAAAARLRCVCIGDWNHPRNQKMIVFTRSLGGHLKALYFSRSLRLGRRGRLSVI